MLPWALGRDDLDDLGGRLTGSEIGEGFGVGGLGLSGEGRGGGGTSMGMLGRSGGGSGYARGGGAGIGSGKVTATGVDAKEAARVISKGRNQLRYCYEKELIADPELDGTLTLSLTVEAGVVTSASASGALPESMRLCVERSAKRWKLAGSGSLTVPVVFSAG